MLNAIIKSCQGLSYYSIQKTLITSIKRSIFDVEDNIIPLTATIKTDVWRKLIESKKKALSS
jgi:hypothetical protein